MPEETTLPRHLLGEEGGAPEKAKRHQDEAGQGGELELDQGHEQLDRDDEETEDDDEPGDEEDRDLDEVREEAGEAHHAGDGGQDRLAGVDADLGVMARLQELGLGQGSAARLKAQAGERIEDRPGRGN